MNFMAITFRTESVHNAAHRSETLRCNESLDCIPCLRYLTQAQRVLWLWLGLEALNRDEADDLSTKNRVILPVVPSL